MTQEDQSPAQPRSFLQIARQPAVRAGVIGGLCLLIAILVFLAPPSIVSRGPNNSGEAMDRAWEVVNNPASSDEAIAEAEAAARKTLKREPLNAGAVSLVGAIREREGRQDEAEALMRTASAMNHRDNISDLWLFQRYLEKRDYEAAFMHADALLRRETEFTESLMPAIADALASPQALPPLAERLAARPGWRPAFVYGVINGSSDPTAAFGILSAIRQAGGQLTRAEQTLYLNRLIERRMYDEAYLAWVLFLPEETSSQLAYIYDGDFDGWPSTRPFGWDMGTGVSGSVEPATAHGRPDDPALLILHNGTADRSFPGQLLVLPPGEYSLNGEVLTETSQSAGRMAWTLTCIGRRDPPANVPAPSTEGQWSTFSARFTIPDDCPGQMLRLRAVPGEPRRAEVRIWYDKISITPVRGTSS